MQKLVHHKPALIARVEAHYAEAMQQVQALGFEKTATLEERAGAFSLIQKAGLYLRMKANGALLTFSLPLQFSCHSALLLHSTQYSGCSVGSMGTKFYSELSTGAILITCSFLSRAPGGKTSYKLSFEGEKIAWHVHKARMENAVRLGATLKPVTEHNLFLSWFERDEEKGDGSAPAFSDAAAVAEAALAKLHNPELTAAQYDQLVQQAYQQGVSEPLLYWSIFMRLRQDYNTELAQRYIGGIETLVADLPKLVEYIRYLKARIAFDIGDYQTGRALFEETFADAKDPEIRAAMMQACAQLETESRLRHEGVALDLPLNTPEGQTVTLHQLMQGRSSLLLQFWASWCGPCRRELPGFKQRAEELAAKNIGFVAINANDQPGAAAELKSEYEGNYPWLVDTGAATQKLLVDSFPKCVWISAQGKILFTGHPKEPELAEKLAAA